MREEDAPFALVVRFTLRPGSEEAFDRLTQEIASGVREFEYGTLIYSCHVVQGNPRQRMFYELYRNRAAFERHEAQEHVRRFLAEREPMLESTEVDILTLQDGKTPPGFQLEAVIAGTQARIRLLRERSGILRAILAALRNLDAVKALVEIADPPEAAQASLMELLNIDQGQARAVLDLQLRALSPQRRQQISAEYEQMVAEQAELESILASPDRLREMVGTERGANLAREDERRWARSVDDDWPGPPLGRAAGSGA
jgi:quinol monooxygenase YgiN